MKRLFVLLFGCLLCLPLLRAQDVIVTSGANRINATVIEVGEKEISYKLYGVQDSRLFTISKEDVVTILLENGKVLVFGNPCVSPDNDPILEAHPILPGTITKQDGDYFLNAAGVTTKLSEDAYLRFIAHNCPEAWQSYQKADHLWSLGWRFFGSGMAGLVLGAPVWGVGIVLQNKSNSNQPQFYYGTGMYYAGIILMAAGAALTVASIPMLSVGQHRRQNSHEVYNACYLEQQHIAVPKPEQPLSLNLQLSADGIGLALRF
ncbi:MAG: hypothetical protein ACI4BD_08945 [Paludibacteraceae bacterium]